MKLRILGAFVLVLAAAGHARADDRIGPTAIFFHDVTKSTCGFKMTPESALKAATTLGMSNLISDPLLSAVFAICEEVKKGNKSKTIEIRVPDNHKVLRKVIVERAKWWQA
ncbi:hypothetical protein GGE16_004215 [Rhizobium leguminosarum]|uniref:Signal recognition particle n=1 Tax=Rhizobium leguminosarum TaxID=384 RepID=A0AAE2SZ30_RHILE|nr:MULTISPECIES: hypothetical protein [Rhizobium]MBB4292139.1 hypothetical protein [Rhizobium leguminosarum]MBB4299688.1 hypothetical protein [Rhizobium leguminosarum]MBB4309923.1 hypothetical protein [Rhizobium leguminosarum]MBB4419336.1 hypothetical protein [Rhizobium leguminosarum]MBB4434140.1 hypothetical protein [Rhizobium esperanzae]